MATRKNKKLKIKSQKAAVKVLTVPAKNFQIPSKLRQPKIFIPLIVIVLILLAFLFKGVFVAALVNGQPISRLTLIQELEKQGGKQALAALVNQTLILQEVKKKNIEVSQDEVDKSAKQIEESLKQQGQDLNTALSLQGMTRQDFLMQLKLRALVEKLLADQIKVTDKEIDEYIKKNKETLPKDLKEDEIKKGVAEQLKQQKLATKSQEWINNLNKNAKINYFVSY